MRYRKLDANGDMMFGRGQADFYRDVPDAPAQAVKTRLGLKTGEWFLDTSEGTPWDTEVLGKYTLGTRNRMVRMRVLDTSGVTSIDSYASSYDPDTRTFSVNMTIDTAYGKVTIAGPL